MPPIRLAQAWGEAGSDLFIDFSARYRGYAADPVTGVLPVPAPRIDMLTAGRDTQVRIGQTVIEAGRQVAGGVLVTVDGLGSYPESGTYYNFYRPDAEAGNPAVKIKSLYPTAAFATGPATAVDATWTFGLAEAGDHVRISAIDSSDPDADTRIVNLLGNAISRLAAASSIS